MRILLFILYHYLLPVSNELDTPKSTPFGGCLEEDVDCMREKLNYLAIKLIHGQIDEDQDGVVELNETKDFLKDELNIMNSDKMSSDFHHSDASISVTEFWNLWKSSEAHNWTESQVLEWLVKHVHLPQYVDIFKKFRISGKDIPRLATNVSFKSKILGITNPKSRKRLQLMALDVVLFGTPLNRGSLLKDTVLTFSLLVAMLGMYFAYKQNAKFQRERTHVSELNEKIEQKLKELEAVSVLKESESMNDLSTESEFSRCGIDFQGSTRDQLELLLSRTYEIECKFLQNLKEQVDLHVLAIRDQVQKFHRKRTNSAFSALKYGYFNSFNEIDTKMIHAKKFAEDYNVSFREFKQRWKHIRELCGISLNHVEPYETKSMANLTLEEGDVSFDVSQHVEEMNLAANSDKSLKFGFLRKRKKN